MSYDLRVFTSMEPALRAPESDEMRAIARPLDGRSQSVELVRELSHETRHLCTADGPFEVDEETDEIPTSVTSSLLDIAWEVQLSRPWDLVATDVRRAERFARQIAESGAGVVYNPQLDRITWPRSVKKLREAPTRSPESTDYLALAWVFSRFLERADGERLFEIFKRFMPEALPQRFGTFEPLQGRLERDGKEAFTALLDDVHMVIWKGSRPLEWGFASLGRGWGSALTPEDRDAQTPLIGGTKARHLDSVKLELQAEVVSDRHWLKATERLFRAVGSELRPVFGGSWMASAKQVPGRALSGRWWLGLPNFPLWLTWIGKPYVDLLPASLPEALRRSSDHAFLASDANPRHEAALAADVIPWDPRLVRRGSQLEEGLAADVVPALDG